MGTEPWEWNQGMPNLCTQVWDTKRFNDTSLLDEDLITFLTTLLESHDFSCPKLVLKGYCCVVYAVENHL